MQVFNTYADEKQYTEEQKQDLLKFTNIINNYTTEYDEYEDADTSSYTVLIELSTNCVIMYKSYWAYHYVQFTIEMENIDFSINTRQKMIHDHM